MSGTNYGDISPKMAEAWAKNMMDKLDQAAFQTIKRGPMPYYWPYAPVVRTGTKKKPGGKRTYQLWIDGQFHGHFRSRSERKAYLDATLTLEKAHGDIAQAETAASGRAVLETVQFRHWGQGVPAAPPVFPTPDPDSQPAD